MSVILRSLRLTSSTKGEDKKIDIYFLPYLVYKKDESDATCSKNPANRAQIRLSARLSDLPFGQTRDQQKRASPLHLLSLPGVGQSSSIR